MKILVISNMYPPYYHGGLELTTQDIVDGLSALGHSVVVLTSVYGANKCRTEGHVWRWLPDPFQYPRRLDIRMLKTQWQTQQILLQALANAKPDLVILTGLVGLSSIILELLTRRNIPHIYVVFDETLVNYTHLDAWYRFWNNFSPNPLKIRLKRVARFLVAAAGFPVQPQPFGDGYTFGSRFLLESHRSHDIRIPHYIVMYPPIPSYFLQDTARSRLSQEPLRLLFAGRICREKGVDTVLSALVHLRQTGFDLLPVLTIAGRRLYDAYERELFTLIEAYGLEKHVQFVGLIPREQMPAMYADHHAIVFATRSDEPFGMVPLEAMASGIAVIATATGGAREFLQDGINALVFAPNDVAALVGHIRILSENETLRQRLIENGRVTAWPFTDWQKWLTQLNSFLIQFL